MPAYTLDLKVIDVLRNIPDLIPVRRDIFEDWNIRVINRESQICRNYLSPNRRGFYKIVFLNEGAGVFTLGINTYHIDKPTILFVHPNEIISRRNLAGNCKSTGHFCMFKKDFLEEYPALRSVMGKYRFFSDPSKNVIELSDDTVETINKLFFQMHEEQASSSYLTNDALQAYMQLIMVASNRAASWKKPETVSDDYKHIYEFFQLLEKETSSINFTVPIRIKTAREFADSLAIHPNYLNQILKKSTGQNLSTHIKNRLVEESKVLLLQTDWTLQDVGYAIGFTEQSNFSHFFKNHTGITPVEFRKSYGH